MNQMSLVPANLDLNFRNPLPNLSQSHIGYPRLSQSTQNAHKLRCQFQPPIVWDFRYHRPIHVRFPISASLLFRPPVPSPARRSNAETPCSRPHQTLLRVRRLPFLPVYQSLFPEDSLSLHRIRIQGCQNRGNPAHFSSTLPANHISARQPRPRPRL